MNVFEFQRLLGELRIIAIATIAPGGDVRIVFVIALRFALWGLKFLAEMTAAGFVSIARIDTHQLSQFEEIGHPAGFLEALVKVRGAAGHVQVAPEFIAQLAYLADGFGQTFGGARHAALIPNNFA